MADLAPALLIVLRHEGVEIDFNGRPVIGKTGYVNNPLDPGGETNYGITKAVAIENGYPGPMMGIPFEFVKSIYNKRYWNVIRGDEIEDQAIANEMLDTAVNCGSVVVIKFLQRVLNVLNKNETLYKDMAIDGVCGSETILCLHAALAVRNYKTIILRALDSLQCVRYIELAEKNTKFEAFMPGWLFNRCGV